MMFWMGSFVCVVLKRRDREYPGYGWDISSSRLEKWWGKRSEVFVLVGIVTFITYFMLVQTTRGKTGRAQQSPLLALDGDNMESHLPRGISYPGI